MQSLQPAIPLLNLLEGYKDLQSVMAVLEAQQSFSLQNNTARFREQDGLFSLPEFQDRLKYLGYFLTQTLLLERPIRLELQFGRPLAGHPFLLLLKAFSVQGTYRFRINQGLSLSQEARADASGQVSFEFEPLARLLKDPSRITGFQVWIMKPKYHPPLLNPEESMSADTENETGIVRAAPQLNVFKHIDTRV